MMAHIYAHEIHHQHFTKAAKAALNRVGGVFRIWVIPYISH